MTEAELIQAASNGSKLLFADVLAVIEAQYHFTPCAFRNGSVDNAVDQNQGSCRVFAFAQRHQLDKAATLNLFAEHYAAVLDEPEGTNHGNIRAFMQSGWDGVTLSGQPLSAR